MHGTRLIDNKQLQELYQGRIIDLGERYFTAIDSSFSISHGVLFAYLVDLKNKNPKDYPSYEEMAEDVIEMIDLIHRDGSLKGYVTERMHQFFIQDKKTPLALEALKRSGKTLFIVTNSDYNYTQKLLDYTITPFLTDHSHWRDLFDVVVTLAAKPKFFTARQRFLKVDRQTGAVSNVGGDLTSGIFKGGNSDDLQDYLNLASDEILYLGDHIYGDILALKKQCHWRTALIVEEIDREVENLKKGKETLALLDRLILTKEKCENKIDRFASSQKGNKKLAYLSKQIEQVDEELHKTVTQYQASFNPYWGEVMRANGEESRFAGQVAKYACIYMAKVSDLADVGPCKYFRPERRALPHDP